MNDRWKWCFMKRLVPIFVFFIFIIMLLYPAQTFAGAKEGLLLWFNTVFPTLFPFMILSSMIIKTNTLDYIVKYLGSFFKKSFHVSASGSFAILGGFLCGYPMGAKIITDLLDEKRINRNEGAYLLSFCNNTSPIFLVSFILLQHIKYDKLILPGIVISIISPIISSQLFYFFYYRKKILQTYGTEKSTNNNSESFFDNLDQSIMVSIESIVQIGGYIIVFSVLVELMNIINLSNNLFFMFLISLLEITNGISIIDQARINIQIKWILSLALASFGGLCSIFQTRCMISKTTLSIQAYTIEKLITAIVTSLLAFLYLILK